MIKLLSLFACLSFISFVCKEKKLTQSEVISKVDSSRESWILEAKTRDNYNGVTMANGQIGLVLSEKLFKLKKVILNNVYDKEFEGGVSRVVAGFEFLDMNLYVDGVLLSLDKIRNWKQSLNMKEGVFTTSFDYEDKVTITHEILALRHLPFMGLAKIKINANRDADLKCQTFMGFDPNEIKNVKSDYRVLLDGKIKLPLFQSTGKSRMGKHEVSAATSFLFSEKEEDQQPRLKQTSLKNGMQSCEFVKSIKAGQVYSFSLSGGIATTKDFTNPKSEAERFAIFALKQGERHLFEGHKKAWNKIWENDIIVEGDLESQKDIRFALYNLFSFSRQDNGLSIAPMGLSSQNYNGHIFWDTELWMYPPLLVFNQDIAKNLLDYRLNLLPKAKEKAKNYGYKGAMFPWESDDTGEEATPTWALTGTFEHHITADVGIAFWNYYRVTKNKKWLEKKGFPLLRSVADFWVSRAIKNNDGTYSIKNVVGADEYAQNVDDNAFTNGSAKACLLFAEKAAKELGVMTDGTWKKIANKIKFHFDENGVMLEHATYKGEKIKQADVSLLAYPIGITKNKDQILKELEYYEPKIDKEWGPAMAHSVLSVIYSSMGDKEKAFSLFKQSYLPNKRPPFGVLSESSKSNNPYFATGAGGMLQAVIFGFAGIRITDSGITQGNSCLPREWKKLTLKGIGMDNKTVVIQ